MNARRAILGLAVAAVAAMLVCGAVLAYLMGLGGLSPGYRARDGDLLLTQIARSALPIIDALDRFRADRGAYPSRSEAETTALTAYLPTGVKIIRAGNWLMFDTGGLSPWAYYPAEADNSAYTLSVKLGWDPRLVYLRNRDGPRWVFVPGDGSEEKPVALRP
jgi:hypothetical protein